MRRRAFTLIEIIVVCTIIALFSALVLPNVVALKASRERDATYSAVLDLAQRGREAAIQSGHTYTLRLEESGMRVVLEPEEETGAFASNREAGKMASAEPEKVKTVPHGLGLSQGNAASQGSGNGNSATDGGDSVTLPEGATLGETVLDGKPSNTSDFALHFYPEGRSEGGGFEMIDRGLTRSLSITTQGRSSMSTGSLPQAGESRWEAGQYEQRSSS